MGRVSVNPDSKDAGRACITAANSALPLPDLHNLLGPERTNRRTSEPPGAALDGAGVLRAGATWKSETQTRT